jgi:ubiquinone/menaquinone biosynthesis C-methylase UbiE
MYILYFLYLSVVSAALLDTFLCFQDNLDNVENYLLEAHRVLKDDGNLIVISHGLPESRLEYFPTEMWTVTVVEMGK